ncbi:flagellar basal body-associated FliL family protein [Povalibacter sp.]|uniref:flagellar basal body-associated FliL family protein n=1 Tax=Povalibacter sp. TaxID=1962978 RepID=UPI002F3F6E78
MAEADVQPAPRSGPSKIVVILSVLLAAVATGSAVYFLTAEKRGAAPAEVQGENPPSKMPAAYVKLDPPFVANFEARGAMRFLQVSVEVMTRDVATADAIKQHDPIIRNDLLMLFGNQSYESISKPEGKEQLRAQALEAVRKIITEQGGAGAKVEQIYFTSFVMQ